MAQSGDLFYEKSNDMVTITDCDVTATSVEIPNEIDGYPVTSIGKNAFRDCTSLTSITIPDSVTSIGYGAFWGCGSLTNITIPDSVTNIGECVFYKCNSITEIIISDNVTTLNNWVFSGCSSLTNITIPNNVISIGDHAFYGCSSLTSVIIPSYVTSIGYQAFRDCSKLTNIIIPDGVMNIGEMAFYMCQSLTSITIPDSVINIGANTFWECSNLTNLTIGSGIASIGDYAFYKCENLVEVYYEGSKDKWNDIMIGIYNDNLTDATIYYMFSPKFNVDFQEIKTVCTIGECAFQNRTEIVDLIIPDIIEQIGQKAFYGCASLSSVSLPFIGCSKKKEEERKTFGDVFDDESSTNLTTVNITGKITEIPNDAFKDWSRLKEINLPETIISIGENAFNGSGIVNLVVPNAVTTLGSGCFQNMNNLSTVSWYSKLYKLNDKLNNEYDVFFDSNINFQVFGYQFISCEGDPNKVDFNKYNELQELDLNTITNYEYVEQEDGYYCQLVRDKTDKEKIWGYATILVQLFGTRNIVKLQGGCGETSVNNGKDIYYTLIPVGDSGSNKYKLIISGHGRMQDWSWSDDKQYPPWRLNTIMITEVEISEGITYVGKAAFYQLSGIQKISLPASIKEIGEAAFCYCTNALFLDLLKQQYTTVLKLSTIEKLQAFAFQGCSKLTEVNFDGGRLNTVKRRAFSECVNLRTVIFPKNDITIDEGVFFNSYNLQTLSIPVSQDIGKGNNNDFSSFYLNYKKYNIGYLFVDGTTEPKFVDEYYKTYDCWFTGFSFFYHGGFKQDSAIECKSSNTKIKTISGLYIPIALKNITIRKGIMPQFYLYRGNNDVAWNSVVLEQDVSETIYFTFDENSPTSGFLNARVVQTKEGRLVGVNASNIDLYNITSDTFYSSEALIEFYTDFSGEDTQYYKRNYCEKQKTSYDQKFYHFGYSSLGAYGKFYSYSSSYTNIICRGKYNCFVNLVYSNEYETLFTNHINIDKLDLTNISNSIGISIDFFNKWMLITTLKLPKQDITVKDPPYSYGNIYKIKRIIGEATIVSLESSCFSESLIEEIDCKIKIKEIPEAAFYCCNNLVSIKTIEGQNITIESNAFRDCKNLQTLIFTEGSTIKSYDESAFLGCDSFDVEQQLPLATNVAKAVKASNMQLLSLASNIINTNKCIYIDFEKEYLWKLLLYGKNYDVYITDNNTYAEQHSYLPKIYASNHNGIEVGQHIELQGENTYEIINKQDFKNMGKIYYRQSQSSLNGKINYYSVTSGILKYNTEEEKYEVDDSLKKMLTNQLINFSSGSVYEQATHKGTIGILGNKVIVQLKDKILPEEFEYGTQIALEKIIVQNATLKTELIDIVKEGTQFVVQNSNQVQTVTNIDEFYTITIEPGFTVTTTGYNEIQITIIDETRILSHDLHKNEVVVVVNTKGNLYIEGSYNDEVKKGIVDEHLISLIVPEDNPDGINPTRFKLQEQEYIVTKVDYLNKIIYFRHSSNNTGYFVQNQDSHVHEIKLQGALDLATDKGFDTTDLHLVLNYINIFEINNIKKYEVPSREVFGLQDGEELYLISCTENVISTNYEVVSRDLEKEAVIERYSTILNVNTLTGVEPQHLLVAPDTNYSICSNNIKTPPYYFETLKKKDIKVIYKGEEVVDTIEMDCGSGLFEAKYEGNIASCTWLLQESYEGEYMEIDKVVNQYPSNLFYNYHLFEDDTSYKLTITIMTQEGLIITKEINISVAYDPQLDIIQVKVEKDCEKQAIKINLEDIGLKIKDLEYNICPRSWLEDQNAIYKIDSLYVIRENLEEPEEKAVIAQVQGFPKYIYDYSFQREDSYKYSILPIYHHKDTPSILIRGVPSAIDGKIQFNLKSIVLISTEMDLRENIPENDLLHNNYQVDQTPYSKWYFKYNTDARNVNIITDKTVFETINSFATVNYSARNYKTGTITAFLGAFHKTDANSDWTYKDSIRLQNKFQEFANNGKIKMLRDEIGNVMPVDITLKSFEYNAHTRPTNISVTFEWTQVDTEKKLTVFEIEED